MTTSPTSAVGSQADLLSSDTSPPISTYNLAEFARSRRGHAARTYPVDQLQPGEGFSVPALTQKEANTKRSAITQRLKRCGLNIKIATRYMENQLHVVRIR